MTETFAAPVVTLGNFDGVHYGHQHIFRLVRERAQQIGGTSIVLTFDPHPQKILHPEREFALLHRMDEKIEIIKSIGIHALFCLRFTQEFATQPPKEFARAVFVEKLRAQEVFVGYDSRFGQGQQGTPEALAQWGREFGFRVTIVPPVTRNGVIVRSTKIRESIRAGAVEEAALLLNRYYALDGNVVTGAYRGATLLGYPTANIHVQHELLPKEGVYIGQIVWQTRALPAVINIGTNPTFRQETVSIEAHILDFYGNVYGHHVKAIFLKRLRDEVTFPHPDALIAQITRDVQAAKDFFRAYGSGSSTYTLSLA